MAESQSRALVGRAVLIVFLSTLVIAGEFAIYSVRWIVLSVLIGIALSVLIYPAMNFLKGRLRIPRGVSAFVFFFGSLAAFAGVSFLLYTVIADQLVPLLRKTPELIHQIRGRVEQLLFRLPGAKAQLDSVDLAGILGSASAELAHGFKLGASALGGFVFTVILSVYLAIDAPVYLQGLIGLWPKSSRPKAEKLLFESAQTIRQWFISQLIAMTAVGALTAFGLWIVGLDYWLLFGFLTGALDIIPYVGPLASALGATLIALGTAPEKTLWVIVVYILMQQIEGHLIIPMVMKERIDLPPAHLMTLMLVLGSWFGIIGLLVAPGALAVGRTVYQKLRSE